MALPTRRTANYLGSKLGIEANIILALDSFEHMKKYIYISKHISLSINTCMFEVFNSSAFQYNSELWTLTSKRVQQIDIFNRRLLREEISTYSPNIISNKELYNENKIEP